MTRSQREQFVEEGPALGGMNEVVGQNSHRLLIAFYSSLQLSAEYGIGRGSGKGPARALPVEDVEVGIHPTRIVCALGAEHG